ncbi:Rad52/Rad22 family DNA repair protein [Deinococcus sp. PEB2-63]
MNLSDVLKRLQAPFPAHMVAWKPAAYSRDRSRALLLAHIDARAVQDRLDAICPEAWSFTLEVVPGTRQPTVKGRLTVLGVTREDIGEAPEGDLGTLKAAASDALKRCAVHFGIGRYLYDLPRAWADWDDAARAPTQTPELPDWARPDHERTPGGAHLVRLLDELKGDMPVDVDLQRTVYKHLHDALTVLRPPAQGEGTPPPNARLAPPA